MKSSHNPYCLFVILPLTFDHFLASLMVMFRFLSLISCHFEASWYFVIASKQTARPGSRPCSRPCISIISSRICLPPFLSSGHVLCVVPPGFSLPLVVFLLVGSLLFYYLSFDSLDDCIRFIRNVTRVIVNCSETDITSHGWGLGLLSELSALSPDLALVVASFVICGFVNLL